MNKDRLILITNPGSSSRKYALYRGNDFLCSLHFEFEGKKVIYTLKKLDGSKEKRETKLKDLSFVVNNLEEILAKEGYLEGATKLDAILARVAAPGSYFATDHIVDEECLKQLDIAKERAPLHAPVIASEIEQLRKVFKETLIIAISDSAFHNDRSEVAKSYAIDTELAQKFDIQRWGYHGLSVGSIVRFMKKENILPEKMIVCHIGSGASITAVENGKSVDTTMGYSPLEGLMMATRAGSIDVAAALAIKRELGLQSDSELEKYLNKKCGLLGVFGKSDDMREVIKGCNEGDPRAKLARELYVLTLRRAIGQMAASMAGVDAIVFTATIGERSDEIRRLVCESLSYLGFNLDKEKNAKGIDGRMNNVAQENSKPIFVIKTDESDEMIMRAFELLNKKQKQSFQIFGVYILEKLPLFDRGNFAIFEMDKALISGSTEFEGKVSFGKNKRSIN